MSLVDSIRNSIIGRIDKRNQELEEFDRMQKELAFQRQQQVIENLKSKNFSTSKQIARQEYKNSSGFNRLRAVNREINIRHPEQVPNNAFSRLSEYTQKNLANRERNLEKTKIMREEARRLREERVAKRNMERQNRMIRNQLRGYK